MHITVESPRRALRGVGIVGHSLELSTEDRDDLIRAAQPSDGPAIPTLAAPRILLTLASTLTLPDLTAVVDALRFRMSRDNYSTTGRGVWTWRRSMEWGGDELGEAVVSTLRDRSGLRGSPALRSAWSLSRPGVRSRTESLLRFALRTGRLPEPEVGYPIAGGGWTATPDLAWPEWKVLVEYEGEHHRTDQRQFEHDVRRFERFLDEGWTPIRIVRPDLFHNPVPMLHRVAARLRAAGWRPHRRWELRPVGAFQP